MAMLSKKLSHSDGVRVGESCADLRFLGSVVAAFRIDDMPVLSIAGLGVLLGNVQRSTPPPVSQLVTQAGKLAEATHAGPRSICGQCTGFQESLGLALADFQAGEG